MASNSVIARPFTDESLPSLQKQFAEEVKRNLFEVYLHPKQTTINLISTTTSSSAAFPGGEAFDFAFSPKGQWCLALNSSRIFIIDIASTLVSVQRELKVRRKPVSAAILDNGKRLAVLSTDHKVNVYDLSDLKPRLLRSLSLDNPPHTITLSAQGEVLAAAYDGGIEVHSLAENAVPTDQRSVKCDRVDSLAFSSDGTLLLGTTQTSKNPSTVILSAPYFTDADQDMPHTELISHMWTSQILFPNSSRDCSHARLLPHQRDGDASWTLTYDSVFESFRAVRTDDLRNGTTYFTGPRPTKSKQRRRSKSRLVPCTLPTITGKGELVAAGFLGSEVWLYGVPAGLDTPGCANVDETSQSSSVTGSNTPTNEASSTTLAGPNQSQEVERLPPWQVLVDKYRNVFAKGRRVARITGVVGMSWVSHQSEAPESQNLSERLVIAAPGGVSGSLDLEQEELASVDGGRLIILDFDRTPNNGACEEMTIEVGNIEPDMLEEENMDMATEIAIVRRRTVAQRRDVLARVSVVDALRPSPDDDIPAVPPLPENSSVGFGLDSTANDVEPMVADDSAPESPTEGPSLEEVANALDAPYSHTNPRSRNTLYRSATAVAANRMRATPRIPDSGHVEYRRTDGTELPHESDADNWVPPPPPYTPDADEPLPQHLRITLTQEVPNTTPPLAANSRRPQRSQTARENYFTGEIRRRNYVNIEPMPNHSGRPPWHRQASDSAITSPQSEQAIVSPLSSRAHSEISSLDDRMPPSATSPLLARRRPVSNFEQRSPNIRGRLDHRLIAPISTVAEPNSAHRHSISHSNSLPGSPTGYPPPTSQLTLSGSNLQQRLDYPLPPPPPPELSGDDPIERRPSPLEPVEIAHPSIPPSPTTPQHPPAPSLPSAYQLNNLQNRYNTVPIPISSPMVPYMSHSQTFPSPTPPRGALGALGRPMSSSRSQPPFRGPAEAPARSLSRSNSRGSGSGLVASTPNLLRPQVHRLDTIYSIISRTDDAQDTDRAAGRPASRFRTRSEGRLGGGKGVRESRWLGRRGRDSQRATPTPVPATGNLERDWDFGDEMEERTRKKKGTRCVVM